MSNAVKTPGPDINSHSVDPRGYCQKKNFNLCCFEFPARQFPTCIFEGLFIAATILFCYSSFTFWQYLHFPRWSHVSGHESGEKNWVSWTPQWVREILVQMDSCELGGLIYPVSWMDFWWTGCVEKNRRNSIKSYYNLELGGSANFQQQIASWGFQWLNEIFYNPLLTMGMGGNI